MSGNRDYQNQMSMDTASVDSIAEQEAASVTPETDGVHQELVDGPPIPGYKPYKMMHGIFGMLPSQEVTSEFARTRELQFRAAAAATGHASHPLGNGRGTDTAAYKSQVRMMNNYAEDASLIPDAQRDYNMLVPLANMAARSYTKTNSVGDQTALSDIQGPDLDNKDNQALAKAGHAAGDGLALREQDSLQIASHDMMIARRTVVSASQGMAKVVEDEAIQALRTELKESSDRKEAIEAKIATITKVVGYLETAGSLVAGGAGFVNEHIPGAPAPAETGPDLRDSSVGKVEGLGNAASSAGGALSTAVTFGVQLYYADELDRIQIKMGLVNEQIAGAEHRGARAAIAKAHTDFENAALIYRTAVEKYEAKINDRRAAMANIGAKADKLIDKKGGDSDISDAMLWTTTVMETQSFLATAMDAGAAAKATLDTVAATVTKHRQEPWGLREDAYTGDNTPRSEGLDGPDVAVLRQMRDLTSWWMEGASDLKQAIDGVAAGQGAETLKKAGYTGDY